MANDKIKKIILIILVVLAAIPFVVGLYLPLAFFYTMVTHDDPDITYAEFPIELTYEMNGETYNVNEIYVVDYAGFDGMLGPTWRGYIKSTGKEGIILYQNNDVKVICELGDANYYIGKVGYKGNIVPPNIYVQEEKPCFLFFKEDNITKLTESDLLQLYGIEIISWTTAEPLDNYWEMINS